MALRGAAATAITSVARRRNQFLSSPFSFHHFPSHSLPSSTIYHGRGIGFKNQICAVQNATAESVISKKERNEKEVQPENWKIKMLYDGDCPLCMREVNMLKERNKQFGTIKFVDISSDQYSPEENQDLDYETVMGRIHAIQLDGTVVKDVEAFRRLYEEVGLGWVYAITKYEPIATIADAAYGVWAKYRLQLTGRPPLEEVLEARRKSKGKTCRDSDACNT